MPAALLRKPLPKPSPTSDPRYRRVMEQLKAGARRTSAHPPAAKKAGDAAAAAKGPPNERLAAGKARQVDKIKEAKEAKPQPASFLSILRAEVAKAMPKTLGETENFDDAAQQMKGGLKGNVAQQKEQSTQDVSGAAKQPPAPAGEAKIETPLPKEGTPPSPDVPAAQAMPAPKTDADVSLQDSKDNVDQQMKEAEVTGPQLQKANDPRFSAVLASKDDVAKNADAGPAKYRAGERPALAGAAAGATAAARVGAAAMLGVHGSSATKVLTRQQQQKARDEAKRKEVVDRIESIYNATKTAVETKLSNLDTEVNVLFDLGVDAALNTMTSYVNDRIDAWKSDRYWANPFAWVSDKLMGLPPEVNAFYEQGRRVFQDRMDKLIVLVANVVELRLKEAKAEVAKGQAAIKTFVDSQPKELQQVAKQAEADVGGRFKELERGIDDKKNDIAQSLAQKYKEAFDKSNEALKAIQEANKGLVTKFAEKLAAVIKALREFKARVMAILQKSEDTIKLIVADPIGFLGNLIAAIKGGINRFADNIWTHLKAGFTEWLFGNLPPGVAIPSDFSIPSIFKLVLGVLGITYDRMRGKAVKLIGERNVKIIEKVADYMRTLITGGVAALWDQVKTDLSNLKEMVFDALQEWLITTLIKKAIAKIVLLFNPVGAIIQAILAIYDVVMFVVEKAAQILAFVESVINSVADIAAGAIDNAVKKVESSLAKTIPLLIGFLARFLGLSGVADKIREFIVKVQDRVDKAIDKAIAKIVETMKKVVGTVKEGVKAVFQWWKREKKFTAGGESHRFFFSGDARNASLKVASDEMSLRDFLAKVKNKKNEGTIGTIEKHQTKIEDLRKKRDPKTPDADDPHDKEIAEHFDVIAELLPGLFTGDEWGTQTNPLLILRYPKKAASLYRIVYLGPRVKEGKLSQSALKKARRPPVEPHAPGFNAEAPIKGTEEELMKWVASGGEVREYRPFSPQAWPPGSGESGDFGIQPQFLVQTGTTFKYKHGSTPGGYILRKVLAKFGYYGRNNGGDDTDADHVLEAQLIGETRANVLGNMWPLAKSENQHGQQLTAAPLEPAEHKFTTLANAVSRKRGKAKDEIYVMIKGTA